MNNWLIHIMDTYGYLGIAVLITIENVFPPIPSEIILTFSGFMTTYTKMHIPGVVISSTVGSILGALLLYQAGNLLTPKRLDDVLSSRVGKLLRLKKEDIDSAMNWFDSKGNYTVFFCRFIPIVRSLISIPAGMAKMDMKRFLAMTSLGSLLWNLALICLGAAAGASWQKAAVYFENYTHAAKFVLVIFLFVGIVYFIRRKKRQKIS